MLTRRAALSMNTALDLSDGLANRRQGGRSRMAAKHTMVSAWRRGDANSSARPSWPQHCSTRARSSRKLGLANCKTRPSWDAAVRTTSLSALRSSDAKRMASGHRRVATST